MKRIAMSVAIIALCSGIAGSVVYGSGNPAQDLNAEPVPGNPHRYLLAIRFASIETVTARTALPAESLGTRHQRIIIPKKEWRYDADSGVLTVDRDIDSSSFIVRAEGRYRTPLRIILPEKKSPKKIKLAVQGRIGKPGADYMHDRKQNEIELVSCVTGDEKFMLQYESDRGVSSIGSMGASDLTRELLAYFGWPVDGNTRAVDGRGARFVLKQGGLRSVWLVQLLPVKNGYCGKDIRTGFAWDPSKGELSLSEAVDLSRYSVYIHGEE